MSISALRSQFYTSIYDTCIHVFVSLPAGQDVRSRLDVLIKCLEARGRAYETPAHKAAFALDPRVNSLLGQPDGDQQIGFELRPAWQDAVSSTMTEFIPNFFAVQAWMGFKNIDAQMRFSRSEKRFCGLVWWFREFREGGEPISILCLCLSSPSDVMVLSKCYKS